MPPPRITKEDEEGLQREMEEKRREGLREEERRREELREEERRIAREREQLAEEKRRVEEERRREEEKQREWNKRRGVGAEDGFLGERIYTDAIAIAAKPKKKKGGILAKGLIALLLLGAGSLFGGKFLVNYFNLNKTESKTESKTGSSIVEQDATQMSIRLAEETKEELKSFKYGGLYEETHNLIRDGEQYLEDALKYNTGQGDYYKAAQYAERAKEKFREAGNIASDIESYMFNLKERAEDLLRRQKEEGTCWSSAFGDRAENLSKEAYDIFYRTIMLIENPVPANSDLPSKAVLKQAEDRLSEGEALVDKVARLCD